MNVSSRSSSALMWLRRHGWQHPESHALLRQAVRTLRSAGSGRCRPWSRTAQGVNV